MRSLTRIATPLFAAALLLLAGCASATLIPDADRAQLSQELPGKAMYLKVSMYKGPFWRDDNKLLLSDVVPTELEYLSDTKGQIIPPGPPTGVVPVGRKVKVIKAEFPTALVEAGRMIYTPRYNPWVYLEVEGEDASKPCVIVLRHGLKNREEFLAVLGKYLTEDDPLPVVNAYPEPVRQAIQSKQVVAGMDPAAVQMAWGYPERKHIDLKGGSRTEVWSYGNGKRTVSFSEGKVTETKM